MGGLDLHYVNFQQIAGLRALNVDRAGQGMHHVEVGPEQVGIYRAGINLAVEAVDRIEDAVQGANVVLTVTLARDPLVRAEWIEPGTHITAVGSDGPDKQELDAEVLQRADLVVADRLAQCVALGEIHHAVDAGLLQADACVELGAIVVGEAPGREADEQITVADLTGVGAQDAAIASATLLAATEKGFGTAIESSP